VTLWDRVVGLFDPAEGYMRKHSDRRPPRRKRFPAAAVLTHGTGSEELILPVEQVCEQERERHERDRLRAARFNDLQQASSSYFEGKAREAVANGSPTIRTNVGNISVRLLRFRNRTGILEADSELQGGRSAHSLTGLERRHISDPGRVIAGYLIWDVVDLDPGSQVLTET
jgi:hypothetical protein